MIDTLPGLRRVEQVMGLPIVVDVRDEDVDHETLDALFDSLHEVDERFSTYKPASEISRISRGELDLDDAHADVREVLARCEELREETGGYFDVHAASPGSLDPSGLVKGWAIERAAGILDDAGCRHYAVNGGGDMCLRGRPLPDQVWRVGIQHPLLRDQVAKTVECNDLAIATSGHYARGEHVFDPHDHRPSSGVLSVTITGPQLATADAYATAAFAMGADGPAWTARLRGYEALTILADETVLSTPGFPAV